MVAGFFPVFFFYGFENHFEICFMVRNSCKSVAPMDNLEASSLCVKKMLLTAHKTCSNFGLIIFISEHVNRSYTSITFASNRPHIDTPYMPETGVLIRSGHAYLIL